jgi:carbonic anhydrase/acetyltransferase-like protein (isoleucine patch superfamily)
MATGEMKREREAWVASNAILTGNIVLGSGTSIWFGCSVRGDEARITLGDRTNLQDNCVVHCDPDQPQSVGADVTVGHGAILHGTRIGDRTLIGMGAILLQESDIGEECIIGAGALVPQGMKVPPRSLVLGVPGRVVRQVTDEEVAANVASALGYMAMASAHCGGKFRRPL